MLQIAALLRLPTDITEADFALHQQGCMYYHALLQGGCRGGKSAQYHPNFTNVSGILGKLFPKVQQALAHTQLLLFVSASKFWRACLPSTVLALDSLNASSSSWGLTC